MNHHKCFSKHLTLLRKKFCRTQHKNEANQIIYLFRRRKQFKMRYADKWVRKAEWELWDDWNLLLYTCHFLGFLKNLSVWADVCCFRAWRKPVKVRCEKEKSWKSFEKNKNPGTHNIVQWSKLLWNNEPFVIRFPFIVPFLLFCRVYWKAFVVWTAYCFIFILSGVTSLSMLPFCLQLGYLSPPVSVYLLFFACAQTVKISLSFVIN